LTNNKVAFISVSPHPSAYAATFPAGEGYDKGFAWIVAALYSYKLKKEIISNL
jgi:hypothetical protein